MPGIPEIIGESQVGTLDPVEEKTQNRGEARENRRRPCPKRVRAKSGMNSSPLRLRLCDFSGEGERAPP